MDNYVLLVAFIAILAGSFAIAAFAAEWLEQNPYGTIAALLHKLFKYFGN